MADLMDMTEDINVQEEGDLNREDEEEIEGDGEVRQETRQEFRERKAREQQARAEERERKAEERRQKADEREKKAEDRERKAEERKQKAEERDTIRQLKEKDKAERAEAKKKRAEELEEARQQRQDQKRLKEEEMDGRKCKGFCGKYRSRNPPNLSKKSRWFVCYGCKNYSVCLKCAADNSPMLADFQAHAEVCDPFYKARIAIPEPAPPQPQLPPQPQPEPQQQQAGFNSDDEDEAVDAFIRLESKLSKSAQGLLKFYKPLPPPPPAPAPEIPAQAPAPAPYVAPTYTYSDTYKGCWTGDSLFYKFDGNLILAKNIIPGDRLLDNSGDCVVVAAVIVTNTSDKPVNLVRLSEFCTVTRGHPIYDPETREFHRADHFNPSFSSTPGKLYNFELIERNSNGLVCHSGIIGSPVGHSFPKVRQMSAENDYMWGEMYWTTTKNLLQENFFPNMKYISTLNVVPQGIQKLSLETKIPVVVN